MYKIGKKFYKYDEIDIKKYNKSSINIDIQ